MQALPPTPPHPQCTSGRPHLVPQRFVLLHNVVAVLLRAQVPLCGGGRNLLAMLVGAGDETDALAQQPLHGMGGAELRRECS